jgi:hypothetical protein
VAGRQRDAFAPVAPDQAAPHPRLTLEEEGKAQARSGVGIDDERRMAPSGISSSVVALVMLELYKFN